MYEDALYGEFELPGMVKVLTKTPEFLRLNCISMDTLPARIVPYGVASRYEHGLGVLRLMLDVIDNNRDTLSASQANLLIAAAPVHDMGNPALSHLVEPFLWQMKRKNGESLLEDVLSGSASAEAMELFGVPAAEVVSIVTGTMKPFSDVLHGSMDVDNLDNVLRYQFVSNGARTFDPRRIAGSYRFRNGRWELSLDCLEEVRKWQAARREVYGAIYGDPHVALASMAYRAVELVFQDDALPDEFFRFTDDEAFEFLSLNDDARPLIEDLRAGRCYEEVASVETVAPKNGLRYFADHEWNARGMVAEYVARRSGIPSSAVCAYCGKGRDTRRIDIPFVDAHGGEYRDDAPAEPIYRLKIFVHPEHADDRIVREYAYSLTA
ncbi:MAG: hypothetical protein P4L67_03725 [Candidatus Pacebacteria bacterium]|nr:hypothetical protein [Candidatus Paceibacterota bacterium]